MERLLRTTLQNGPNGAQAVIDNTFSNSPFLPISPKEILKSGEYSQDVGLLLGCNKDEGLFFTAGAYQNPSILEEWRSTWAEKFVADAVLGLEGQTNFDKQTKEAINKIKKHYIGTVNELKIENINKITDMYTDAVFCHPAHDFVSRRIADKRNIFYKNSTFQYKYTHQGQLCETFKGVKK